MYSNAVVNLLIVSRSAVEPIYLMYSNMNTVISTFQDMLVEPIYLMYSNTVPFSPNVQSTVEPIYLMYSNALADKRLVVGVALNQYI